MEVPYAGGLVHSGPLHSSVRGPVGQKLSPQITGMLSLKVQTDVTLNERKRPPVPTNVCAKYEGPQQLDIQSGDMIFAERRRGTQVITDENPFAAFNGLPKENGIWGYHNKYRFVGVALDAFPYSSGSLAPTGFDVQISGTTNFVNGAARIVYPGEYLTWIPDTPDMNIDVVLPPQAKVPRTSGAKPNKAKIVPLWDVAKDFIIEMAADNITAFSTRAATIETSEKPKITAKLATQTYATMTPKNREDLVGVSLGWQLILEYLPVFLDRAIGICLTATREGTYGQMRLL